MDEDAKQTVRDITRGLQEAFSIALIEVVLALKNNQALRTDQLENALVSQLHRLQKDPQSNPLTVGILSDLLESLDHAIGSPRERRGRASDSE
jgi:phage gp45-like